MSAQIIIVALVFAAIGIYGLFAPRRVFAHFGVSLETPDSRNEVRAVYGGMCLALAVLLVEAPFLGALHQGILLTAMVLLLGMAMGRIISLVVERPGALPLAFLATELLGAGLLYSVMDFSPAAGA
ncbi:MAG: DUF4345 family protein [Alphaproteobacteria bacterium]|nr:DUF4345 family protein [Alphaproteobacteria bacterium]